MQDRLAPLLMVCAALFAPRPALAQLGVPNAELASLIESDAVHAGTAVRTALRILLPEGLHVNSNKPRDPLLIPIALNVDPPPGVSVSEIVYPEPTELRQEGAEQPLSVFEREFAIGVRFQLAHDLRPGPVVVPASLRYQACDEIMCYKPITVPTAWTLRVVSGAARVTAVHTDVFSRIPFGGSVAPQALEAQPSLTPAPADGEDGLSQLKAFSILGTTGGYMGKEDFLTFIRNAEAGVEQRGWFEGRGALAILLLVFMGGLALNLTPCVLPMIPINLAIIRAGAQAGNRRRGFLLGATYGAAMALAYGVLGLIVILSAGTFGTINASPWFNAGIAALFVVLALAMFDFISIDFSHLSSRFSVGDATRRRFLVAFTMGAVAALLAGACIAPVVIQVVVFSSSLYASGTTAALALPFLLGIGMATPWPIAGAGIAALPKPGVWMLRIKQAFGVVIFATAAYYGYTAYGLFADRWVDPMQVASTAEEKLKEGWYSSLAEGLATARREGKPVLIDLWATWCKNCLTMDKTTLADPDVIAATSGYVKIKFQAEDPDETPAKEVMQRFGAIGLPTYAIVAPQPRGTKEP